MDERQLAELFRDAAEGGPPAGFGHADVVAASRKATARRRMALAGGSALSIAVLVGGVVVGGDLLRDTGANRGATTAASAEAEAGAAATGDQPTATQREDQLAAPPGEGKAGPDAADRGGKATTKVIPWPGPATASASCGPVDGELANALLGELRISAEPQPVPDACPPGARAAAVPVPGGWIYAVLAPVAGGATDAPVTREDGAVGYAARTPTGQLLLVLSVPAGTNAPQADQTQELARRLAQRY